MIALALTVALVLSAMVLPAMAYTAINNPSVDGYTAKYGLYRAGSAERHQHHQG